MGSSLPRPPPRARPAASEGGHPGPALPGAVTLAGTRRAVSLPPPRWGRRAGTRRGGLLLSEVRQQAAQVHGADEAVKDVGDLPAVRVEQEGGRHALQAVHGAGPAALLLAAAAGPEHVRPPHDVLQERIRPGLLVHALRVCIPLTVDVHEKPAVGGRGQLPRPVVAPLRGQRGPRRSDRPR